MERAGETVYVEDERTGEKSKYVVTSTFGERIILEKVPEDRLTSDYDLIVELSQTVAKLKRRIDELEEEYKQKEKETDSRLEMIEEDVEKVGRKATEADYKAGQALTSLRLNKNGFDSKGTYLREIREEMNDRFEIMKSEWRYYRKSRGVDEG